MQLTTFKPIILAGYSGTSNRHYAKTVWPVEVDGKLFSFCESGHRLDPLVGETCGYKSDERDYCQTLAVSDAQDTYTLKLVSEKVKTAKPLYVETRYESVELVPQDWDRRMRLHLLTDLRTHKCKK